MDFLKSLREIRKWFTDFRKLLWDFHESFKDVRKLFTDVAESFRDGDDQISGLFQFHSFAVMRDLDVPAKFFSDVLGHRFGGFGFTVGGENKLRSLVQAA